jgi:rhodanese-related sulfurtransferase
MSPHFTRVVKSVFGYKNVKYMVAGHKTWQEGINAYYTEPEFLKITQDDGLQHILIDLRSTEKAQKEHIKGAVNYPVDGDLSDVALELNDDLPQKHKKDTRIIYYSDDPQIAEQMMKTMRANYWQNGYILNGGIQAWKAKGYPVESGQLYSEIRYEGKTTLPGAMSIPAFEKIARHTPNDTVIVDVRAPGEWTKTGIVPGALTIPIDTMHRRYTEVPKDKKVIIHCAAGNRALQVWRMLKDNGYKNVSWVDGKVKNFSKGILQQGYYGKS